MAQPCKRYRPTLRFGLGFGCILAGLVVSVASLACFTPSGQDDDEAGSAETAATEGESGSDTAASSTEEETTSETETETSGTTGGCMPAVFNQSNYDESCYQ